MNILVMKTAGALLLFVSALLTSRRYAEGERGRLRDLESLMEFVRYVRTQIDCFLLPIDQITRDYKPREVSELTAILQKFPFPESIEKLRAHIHQEEYGVLETFANSLGRGYRDEQIKLCTLCLDGLEEIRTRQKKDIQSKIKMVRSFCLLGSLMVILLFL